ncbi:SDR family oxidoreductase [Dongia sp.]|uniref:SDR family oxidoreductase n=1 Tax=Dongia sp. TaxID=1977262 RepID=UPI00375047B5
MTRLSELMNLDGRVALVTGGTGHLGRVMVATLVEMGARVAVHGLQPDEAEKVADAHGKACAPFPADLADQAAVVALPDAVKAKFGRLDILINNAAFVGTSALKGWAVPFQQQSVETWRRAIDVNLTAVFALTQAAALLLAESGCGSVINIASIYGLVGPDLSLYSGTALGNPAAYAASKGGLIQLTRWLATSLAPRVRVNALTPGGIARGQPPEFVERYVARTPLGRMGRENDMIGAVAYLASDLSAYVTGQNIVVDGGWTAW